MQMAAFSLGPHVAFFLCVCTSLVSLCVQVHSSYKGTSQIGSEATLVTSSWFNYLLKSPISKYNHILRYWGLRLQHMNFGGHTQFINTSWMLQEKEQFQVLDYSRNMLTLIFLPWCCSQGPHSPSSKYSTIHSHFLNLLCKTSCQFCKIQTVHLIN